MLVWSGYPGYPSCWPYLLAASALTISPWAQHCALYLKTFWACACLCVTLYVHGCQVAPLSCAPSWLSSVLLCGWRIAVLGHLWKGFVHGAR